MSTGEVHWIALAVFAGLFLLVTFLGFIAARWKAGDMKRLNEWALGGQRFGIVITWFLVGRRPLHGLYRHRRAGTRLQRRRLRLFCNPLRGYHLSFCLCRYAAVLEYLPPRWTPYRGRFCASAFPALPRSQSLLPSPVSLRRCLTSPCSLSESRWCSTVLGLGKGEFPLIVAFVILALYTYKSGLRAPAMIAFVKDVLIYVTVIAAVLVIPVELGGYGPVFEAADKVFAAKGGVLRIVAETGSDAAVFVPGSRFCPGALHVPAFGDRNPQFLKCANHSMERDSFACLHAAFRV